jgi:hypothetical protein
VVYRTLVNVTGSAGDAGVGLGSVTLRLYRASSADAPAGFWNGTSWDASYQASIHELPTTGTTGEWSFALPPLAEGRYTVRALARDRAGNWETTPASFTIDASAPEVLTITTPADGAMLTSLPAISGTARDTVSGVERVELFIQRSDGQFWTGTAWGAVTPLATNYASGAWNYDGALPSGELLADGGYTLTAKAFDQANNESSVSTRFSVDNTAPAVSVTNPESNGVYASLNAAFGTATDSGSGVARVTVALYRASTLTMPAGYWNGTGWDETYNAAAHELAATGTAEWNIALPLLEVGSYSVRATAVDVLGNSGSSGKISFTIIAPAPLETQPSSAVADSDPSEVELSTAEANVSSSAVRLSFTGQLDSKSASTALIFSAKVNGRAVNVESAIYNEANYSVTLQLPANSLHVGDQVVVAWSNLRDAQGRLLTGQTDPLVAR